MSNATARDTIAHLLQQDAVFGRLPLSDLEAIATVMTYREFLKGAFIARRNDRGGILYLLVSGRAKLTIVSPMGKELALSYVEPPALLGDIRDSGSSQRATDIVAVSDVEVLGIEARDLVHVISVQPQLAVELIGSMSDRIHQLTTRLEDMAFHDATHRVKRVLLNIATASYEVRGLPVVEGFTHYEVATLAGTSRETASRVVSNLARDGLVATKGRKIVVDLLGLRDALEASDPGR